MFFALIGAIIGAAFGVTRARRAKGNRLDMLQYAAGYGLAFALAGFILAIIVVRSFG